MNASIQLLESEYGVQIKSQFMYSPSLDTLINDSR